MDRGTITLDLTGDSQDEGWLEPVAGGLLWSDRPLRPGSARAPRPPAAPLPEDPVLTPVYDGPGLVEGGIQRIRSLVANDGTRRVEFEDGESFLIAADGSRIARVLSLSPKAPGEPTLQRALGAPMALALATRDVFLLHASALARHGGVVAICGESGTGKSTLAAASSNHAELGFSRVADDQLPVELGARSTVLPHFPQLKLPPEDWRRPGAPASLPLAMVVEAVRRPPERGDPSPRIEPLQSPEACLLLAGATVAARLFDAPILRRHLAACAAAAEMLRVSRLHYASGLDRLDQPLSALARSMERLPHPPPRDGAAF